MTRSYNSWAYRFSALIIFVKDYAFPLAVQPGEGRNAVKRRPEWEDNSKRIVREIIRRMSTVFVWRRTGNTVGLL
jgi:hypothetical protein